MLGSGAIGVADEVTYALLGGPAGHGKVGTGYVVALERLQMGYGKAPGSVDGRGTERPGCVAR